MPTYASGVYNNENALGKIYSGENQVQRVFDCKETAFVPEKEPFFADFLIVAGGGGGNGGLARGGSGAGGMRTGTKKFYENTNYTLTVGAGGAHASVSAGGQGAGSVGGDSSIERRSHGGGVEGTDGGSGAGSDGLGASSSSDALAVDCGESDVQGKDGAAGSSNQGGGGGGHNAAGSTPNGGAGSANSITGSSVTYAGGGGGGSLFTSAGTGGAGGGGAGGDGTYTGTTYSSSSAPPQSVMGGHGTANTGGGGGGGGYYQWDTGLGYNINSGGEGGNGGSGFVVLKYPNTKNLNIGSGLTSSTSTSGDYKITQFTAGSDTISFGLPSYTISLVSDGSSTYQAYGLIQLPTLPAGATGYKLEMTGTESSAFTGVILAVLSPTNNTPYYVNTQAGITNNPSDNGPQNKNMYARFVTASNQVKIYAHNDNGATAVTVKITAINNSYEAVSQESNQLTGIVIDEDG